MQKDPRIQKEIAQINKTREANANKQGKAAEKGESGGDNNGAGGGAGGDNGGGSSSPVSPASPHSDIAPSGAVAQAIIVASITPVSYSETVKVGGPAGDGSLVAKSRSFTGIPLIAKPAPAPGSTMVAFSAQGGGWSHGSISRELD